MEAVGIAPPRLCFLIQLPPPVSIKGQRADQMLSKYQINPTSYTRKNSIMKSVSEILQKKQKSCYKKSTGLMTCFFPGQNGKDGVIVPALHFGTDAPAHLSSVGF